MPRVHDYRPSHNAGEVTPRLFARTDFSKYDSAGETVANLVPLAEGALMRRPGSRYVAEAKSSTVKGRLKRFEFSTTQAYVLELGDSIMRFYRHQGQISVADTDASVTNGAFTSNINDWDDVSTGSGSIAHDSTNGRLSLVPGGTGGTDIGIAEQDITTTDTDQEHVIKFRVIGAPGDKIEFQVGTATGGSQILSAVEKEVGYHCVAFTPTASPFYVQFRNLGSFRNKTVQIDDVSLIDNAGVEIDTPWPEADLFGVEGPQTADVLYLFHESYPTHKLQRFGHTTWSLVEVAWEDGPYLDENTTATTLTPSANTGLGINLTLSATTGVNDGDGWQSTDIGRLVRYKKSSSWGYAVIVSITSTTVAVADVRADFEATPTAQTTWRLGAWSGTTGYASAAAFFEQRLYAASTTDQPQTFWASQTSDFENFKPDNGSGTVEDDDALDFTLSADDVSAIQWISAGDDTLVIGTRSGQWIPSSQGAVLTPSDITVRRQTTTQGADIEPVRVDNVVLFAQRGKRKVREFAYSFESDGYRAQDMTRLSQHITYGGIVEMDYQEEPDSLIWAVRNDGRLLSMTYRRDEDVVGWARHTLGGVFNTAFSKVWQVDESASTYTDETTDANDAGNADWTLFPASEAVNDYAAFGFTEPFSRLSFDYANGTAGVGGAVTWEYWNGTEWLALSDVVDNTSGFTAAAADNLTVTWTRPTGWKKKSINSSRYLYYVRARITTVYSTNPVLDQGFVGGPAVVDSVAIIPGADGAGQTADSTERSEVWLIVKRTINGSTKRFIEVLERDFEDGHDQEDAYYADSLITYDGAAATAITGLDHLEGEIVKVWSDGAVAPNATVSSGQITLDTAASVVQVGLGYTHKWKSLKFDRGNPAGTAVGKTKRIYALTFVLHNSHTLDYGPDAADLLSVDFRNVGDAMDTGVELFTGERLVEMPGDYELDPRVYFESDDPAPFMLLAIAPEIEVNALK